MHVLSYLHFTLIVIVIKNNRENSHLKSTNIYILYLFRIFQKFNIILKQDLLILFINIKDYIMKNINNNKFCYNITILY